MWTAVAVSLYLLPIVGFCLVRARADRSPLRAALDVPLAVGADFLLVLLVSRLLILDYSVLIVRALSLPLLAWFGYKRASSIRAAISWEALRRLAPALACAALALCLSTCISVPYAIWDRHWHIPLVTSLRGQHAPFHNVYEPHTAFFYHYSGDALGAIFQALSFAHLHASAALSRAHDVFYALTGYFLGAALLALGVRRSALAAMVVLGMLAGGPVTLLMEGAARPATGWSTVNLLSLSFRPHEPLGYLFASTLLVAGLAPLVLGELGKLRWLLPVVAVAVAVLALSDELTLAMTLGTLGVAWLLAPREAVGPWRERWLFFATPPLVVLLTLLLLGGTFSLGAPKQHVELVRARLPGYYLPSFDLGTREAQALLLSDYAAPFGVMLAAVLSACGRRDSRGFSLLVAHFALLVASLLALLVVQVNYSDMESHRAVTGLNLLTPLLLVLWVSRLPEGGLRSWVLAIGGVACLFSVASTVEWVRGIAKVDAPRLKSFWGADNFYATDCVKQTGARLGERPLPAVGSAESWYLFGGCRPLFAQAGGPPGGHVITVGWPDASLTAFAKTAEWAKDFEAVRLFYPHTAKDNDAVSGFIQKHARDCVPAGNAFTVCDVAGPAYLGFAK